jgi:hypothetical protein
VEILLYTPVWGERYINTLLSFGLPSLLSNSNVPLVSRSHSVTWLVLTTPQDRAIIGMHQSANMLSRFAGIEWVDFEPRGHKYSSLSRSAAEAANHARRRRAVLISTMADQIWGAESFGRLAQLANDCRVVLGWSGMLGRDAEPHLESFRKRDSSVSIPHRELSKLLIRKPHENQRRWQVSDVHVPQTPTSVIWSNARLGDALVRSHILGPIAVNFASLPDDVAERYTQALARGYAPDEPPPLRALVEGDVEVIGSSDVFVAASLDDDSRRLNSPRREVARQSLDDELFETLRRHQRWETILARRNFGREYWLVGDGDIQWLKRMTEESRVTVDRLAASGRTRNPAILIWNSLAPNLKRAVLSGLMSMGLYRLLFRIATGYWPGSIAKEGQGASS